MSDSPVSTKRHFAMCRPDHFEVVYAINPWMTVGNGVDKDLAMKQWENLKSTYESLGHRVDVVEPGIGLPDMVFAANCATIIDRRAFVSKFKFPERQGETELYAAWLESQGIELIYPESTNEGEGDFLVLDDVILAGTGYRTSVSAHAEIEQALGRRVISLELTHPSFYHLDVAIAVLDKRATAHRPRIAYYPDAFSLQSRETLKTLFPDAIQTSEPEAMAFALNSVSDGDTVVIPSNAGLFGEQLRLAGYQTVEVDLSEFLKAGGSVKCCTLEFH